MAGDGEAMSRSMDEILSDKPLADRMPEGAESDSEPTESVTPAVPVADKGATPVAAKGAVQAAKSVAPEKAAAKAGDDDEPEEAVPDDLEGLKTALKAARGDARKFRKQWRDVDRKVAMMEGREAALRQQPQATPAQKPEKSKAEREAAIYGDLPGSLEALEQRMTQAAQNAALQTKLAMSEAYARRAHPDFEEKLAAVKEAAANNPALVQHAFGQPDPAEFLYQTGARLLLDKEIGSDPNAWREAERAKIRAEIEAERSADPAPAARPPIPKSIATARGNGAGATPAWAGPRSLDDVLA